MQIRPENPGLAQAGLVAAHTPGPVAGLSKPDLAGLIQKLNAADVVALLDVAPSDMGKLTQILQSGEPQLRPNAQGLAPSASLNPPSPATETRPVEQPLLVNQTAAVNRPESVDRPEVVNPPGSANQATNQANVVNQPVALNRPGSVAESEIVNSTGLVNQPIALHQAVLSTQLNAASLAMLLNRPEMVNPPQLVNPVALANPSSEMIPVLVEQTGGDHAQAHITVLVAKFDAQVKLSQAEQTVEQSGGRKLPEWETSPQILLQIGHRLYNAGGYGNYIRASAVADTIQSAYWGATLIHDQIALAATRVSPLGKEGALPKSRAFPTFSFSGLSASLRVLWRRAPLLVLLLSWLAVGIFGGILFKSFNFEFWALGFLALVGFGFYSTIRK
jgi:hypothetical protein